MRLTIWRANQGLSGVISQSAKTSRRSLPGGHGDDVPSGNIANSCAFSAPATLMVESSKTISSFHSPVDLYPICEKKDAIAAKRSSGHLSARTPINVIATILAMASGSRLCVAR